MQRRQSGCEPPTSVKPQWRSGALGRGCGCATAKPSMSDAARSRGQHFGPEDAITGAERGSPRP
jgi:hypothetical protein